jgi:tyrosine-specific transport protein
MKSKFIGAIFLILGTCFGGSMLALPIATANEGIGRTFVMMLSAWIIMTLGAFALLRVNLRLPEHSNLISMARITLGKTGAAVTWVMTLMLFYTLLSAYISSGEDILAAIFNQIHLAPPMWLNAVLFTGIFGFIVFRGIYCVDVINRGLMSSKLLICLILILFLIPFTHSQNLSFTHAEGSNSLMTCITAFGYASILPSIRSYLNSNAKKLYFAAILGGFIPLLFYLAWIIVVQGTIPAATMSMMKTTAHPLKVMVEQLAGHVNNHQINALTNVFTSICVLTSFLSVSLGLSDFLADGTKIDKQRHFGNFLMVSLALIPPLIIVLLSPAIFLRALNYAGILCVALLFMLPILMTLSLLFQRDKRKSPELEPST